MMPHHNAVTLSRREYDAVIFDMDGVITRTATVHRAAWKRVLDDFLRSRQGPSFQPFSGLDYKLYVDGKDRFDGTSCFLETRGIEMPPGNPDDPPGSDTIHGIANKKNQAFQEIIREQGVEAYDSTIALIQDLRKNRFKTAVISASKNACEVLRAARALDLFDARVDGTVAAERGLKGKPAPDLFVEAARELGTGPERAVVVEDAVAGVVAGKKGGFGLVIGVDREDEGALLEESGADVVVKDLDQVSVVHH